MMKSIAILLFLIVNCACFAQKTRYYNVIIRSNAETHTLWDGNVIDIFGFTSALSVPATLPGRTLYAEEGDTVIINAWNIAQGDHHTIHLHGLDVDTRNDGDPMTSFSLEHMQDTTYTFVAHNAGTYIYHCHVGDVVHVQMGMYGLIVVKAKGGANTAWTGGPEFHKDYKWLMTEVDKSWHDSIPAHDTVNETIQLPPYRPGYFLINGKSQQQLNDDSIAVKGAVGEKIYMRLANIGFFDNQVVFPPSLNAVIIASDGRPLPTAVVSDTVYLSPGERYGVMLTPSVEFTGTIDVEYIDMNTGIVWQTEKPSVIISGFLDINEGGEPGNKRVRLYPNPASNFIEAEFSGFMPSSVKIINSLGQVVKEIGPETTAESGRISVNIKPLANGVYYMQFMAQGHIYRKKFVVAK